MSALKFLRAFRILVVAALIAVMAIGVQGAATTPISALYGFTAAILVTEALLLLALAAQTRVIRRVEHANRPRPDYSAIAAMEREVYGRTFEHDGLPREEPPGPPPDH